MDIEVRFPGGYAVEAMIHGHRVSTDQPAGAGGLGEEPSPFDLFLASIATCAGYYALRFCAERGIDTKELTLVMRAEKDPETRRVSHVRLDLGLPAAFPERYRPAILRAVDQCTVKRHLAEPPDIETVLVASPTLATV